MPGLATIASTARRRASWFVRDRYPFRPVTRRVQGVDLVLPWAHRLPEYAEWFPAYGQNLVQLAALLGESGPLTMLDIGANVGDSAVQVLNGVDGAVLCVEADRAYLDFLHRNVDADDRIEVAEALLVVGEDAGTATAVRTGGTTRFVEGGAGDAMPTVSPAALRAAHPRFEQLRLVKSDTDGYDVTLVPGVAREWAHAAPVLFFEYDPYLTRLAGNDPFAVWAELADLGYADVAIWGHRGEPIELLPVDAVRARAEELDAQPVARARSRSYWDVAVAHADDAAARAALARLIG